MKNVVFLLTIFLIGDPVFYLHHTQLDRVYWLWQNLDWENRQVSLALLKG